MEISPVEEQEVGVPTGTETSEEVNEDIFLSFLFFFFLEEGSEPCVILRSHKVENEGGGCCYRLLAVAD